LNKLNFKKSKILVVGDVMLDEYMHGSVERISPEAPVPVFNHEISNSFLGGAANVASNLSTLGCNVGLLSIAGDDETYKKIKNLLIEKCIKNYLICDGKVKTIKKTRVVEKGHQLLRLDEEKNEGYSDKNYSNLKKKYEDVLSAYDVVIFSDYNKHVLRDVKDLIGLAKIKSKKIIVDPKGDCFKKYYGATIVTPNFKEFINIVGPVKDENELIKKAIKLKKSNNFKNLLITRSEKGMTLINKENKALNYPSKVKTVYDVTGAGDTVIASLSACLSAKMPIEDAVKISNIAAGIVVSKSGTTSITIDELNNNNIFTSSNMDALTKILKTNNNKIVFTNGCFDIIHLGHIKSLKEAADLGDILVVGINSDDSIKRLKGPSRPINDEKMRSEVLSSLSFVDYVVIFEDDNPLSIIKSIKPDVLAKGSDYNKNQVVGSSFVESYGGRIELLPLVDGYSTTDIITKVQKGKKRK